MPEHPHRRSGGRPGRRVALGAAVVLLLVLAWAGFQGWRGARELQAAAGTLTAARADLGDGERARAQLDRAGQQTAAARRHLTDPVLRAFAAVPRLGDPLDTAAGLARAADTTVLVYEYSDRLNFVIFCDKSNQINTVAWVGFNARLNI